MLSPIDCSPIPFLALYAETHFRFFRFFPSLLYQRWPEVVFDAPRRLDPGMDLPIVLIANELHRFPAVFSDCSISISTSRSAPKRFDFKEVTEFETDHPLSNYLKAFMFRIPRNELPGGLIYVNAKISVTCGRKKRIVLNDNLPTTSKLAFSCYVSDNRLPGSELCEYGDAHVHSHYSQSHVEFGPPLCSIDAIAKAGGLAFVGITDHSYDLACAVPDYLQQDREKPRWRLFREEIGRKNAYQTILVPGEEISCINSKQEVVHLGGLNLHDYLPGNLDGARKGRFKDTQLRLPEAIEAIHRQGGIAFAAHPGVPMGFMQRLFLSRGEWSQQDLSTDLDAMQLFNNGISLQFNRGKDLWIKMLQRGAKVPLLAGNDAHGDFNRYRAIKTPFLTISDNYSRYMGCGKTGIYGKRASPDALLSGIKEGATFITTGPFVAITHPDSPTASIVAKKPLDPAITSLLIHAISTPEFGPIARIDVFCGKTGIPDETVVFSQEYRDKSHQIHATIPLPASPERPSYLRAEITCSKGEILPGTQAYTSAVFF